MFLFPDTHFFLHFKHAQEIPWSEVTDADPLHLIIGRAVQKEIEKHKYEMRGRPQDRARDYATKLARVVLDERPLMLREKKPQVLLDYRATRPAGWSAPGELDLAWGDDMLIADVLAFRAADPAVEVAVLTGDPGLIAKAKSFDVPVIALAGRGWEQPPEKTTAEKEVERLRRENENLKRIGPRIACHLFAGDKEIEEVQLELVRHPPLTPDQIDVLLAKVRANYPRTSEFSTQPNSRPSSSKPKHGLDLSALGEVSEWRFPTEEEINTYTGRYDAWYDELTTFLRETPAQLNEHLVSIDLRLVLQNDGNEPGQGTRLTVETVGGFLLSDLNDDAHEHDAEPGKAFFTKPGRFRAPPRHPQPTRVIKPTPVASNVGVSGAVSKHLQQIHHAGLLGAVSEQLSEIDRIGRLFREPAIGRGLDSLVNVSHAFAVPQPLFDPNLLRPLVREPRDVHAFYWRKTPSRNLVERWELECDEFQHRMDAEVFSIRVTAIDEGGLSRRGAIKVRLFARNMRQPFERVVPVRVVCVDADTLGLMAGLLP